jgi:hypothetical protein
MVINQWLFTDTGYRIFYSIPAKTFMCKISEHSLRTIIHEKKKTLNPTIIKYFSIQLHSQNT